jgi:2-dehydropantoate 2-reductase
MGPILVWGAGAIGGTLGAWLVRAGHDVRFVDIVPEHVAAIRDCGLRITGPVDQFTVRAPAFLPDEVTGSYRHIFLAVKAHHTETATTALAPHLAADGAVLSLQNGLCETIISRIVGRERTIGAFVNYSADWIAPGEILFGSRSSVVLGELDGSLTPRLRALHQVIRDFEPDAIITDNIWGYLWGKLGYGAMLFAQALGNLGIADCLARPELLPLWRALAREALAVAAAEGVRVESFPMFDPAAFQPDAPPEAAAAAVARMVALNRPSAKTHSGVWRDLAIRKRRTEVDVQIAPIVEIGARHGVPTPTIARLVAMIHEIEQGRRTQADSNLLELMQS